METISLILSVLALIGSIFTYFYHDKKIKTQELRINEHKLSNIENEKNDALKAKVRANSFESGNGNLTIRILNSGRAAAKNIRIEFNPGDYNNLVKMDQFPFPYLNPLDSTDILIFLVHGMPNTIEIKIYWDDDYQANNTYSQIITL